MSLYGAKPIDNIEKIGNSREILEAYFIDDIIRMPSDDIKTFCESEEAKILVEKAVLSKPTLMRLDKKSDELRRTKLIAYQLAKNANDPNWTKLVKYQKLRKECIQKIMDKYGTKAAKIAKVAQKNYIKTASKVKATKEEEKSDKK
jgi:hypothetical protein